MGISTAQLTGKTDQHLCAESEESTVGARLHREAVGPFLRLREAARESGFDLQIFSGFRGFDHQLSIWNRKASGKLCVLDSDAAPLDLGTLSETELMFAILRWSALPGASRHHWGTDLDVYDAAARPTGYEIQLIPDEVDPGGMFGPLHEWLDQRIAARTSFGFFRPYDRDRGGVAPERWHLSYAPIATRFLDLLTVDILQEAVGNAEIELKSVVLQNLQEIYDRFVTGMGRPLT